MKYLRRGKTLGNRLFHSHCNNSEYSCANLMPGIKPGSVPAVIGSQAVVQGRYKSRELENSNDRQSEVRKASRSIFYKPSSPREQFREAAG